MDTLKIGIVLGSTRKARKSPSVGEWVLKQADHVDADFELIDIKDYRLPFLGEEGPSDCIEAWKKKVASLDAFLFVVPEYNHSMTAALKNALDMAYDEWNDKAAGLISYGSSYGARAAEQARLVLAELQVATVRNQVLLSLFEDFKDGAFTPREMHAKNVKALIDQTVRWAKAMKQVRTQ